MRALLAVCIALALVLPGCADDSPKPGGDDPPLDVDDTTGGIRGVAVDQAVRPLAGLTVRLHSGEEAQTDDQGRFQFTGLAPGEYFLTAQKAGYQSAQASTTVVAGVADPPAVRLQLIEIPGMTPYVESFKMEGFYDCAMGTAVVTDACDWPYRTGWDVLNESGNPPPTPRSVQEFHNTEFYDVAPSVQSIVQEAFWDDPQVSTMKVSLDATPIDASCDCSSSYMEVEMGSPTYNRMDGERIPAGETVAARGFLPFGDPQVAQGFSFVIITTMFHNHKAPEGWTFETREQFPVG